MSDQVLNAATMAHAVLSDPQFNFPSSPRLVPGLVCVPTESGLIVEGGPSRQHFQGTSARRLLPQLMAALDGGADPDTLAERLNTERTTVWSAMSLLYTTGLLEQADIPDADMVPASVEYLARSIDTTRVNTSGVAAYRRLAAASIAIVAEQSHRVIADELGEILLADHVGSVQHLEPGDPAVTPDTTLLLTLGSSAGTEAAGLHARELGISILPAEQIGGSLMLGPILDAGHAACMSCLMHQRHSLATIPGDQPTPAVAQFAAELIAREALVLVSRVGTGYAANSLVSVDLLTWAQRSFAVAPRVQCPVCMDPSGPDADDLMPLSWAYAHSVSFAPRKAINPKDHQVHYKSGNLALQQSHRRWLSSPTTELPPYLDLEGEHPGRIDLASVATVLRLSFGLRNGSSAGPSRVDRWCATGGNLGSTTGYLIARDVEGLSPGVYGYQREQDDLARLTWADPHQGLAGIDPDERALLVITGAMDTVAPKYGPFAWRIVHLDSGAALAQTHLVADRLGLAPRPYPVWDDAAIADLIGSDADCEPVTAVISLRTTHHLTSGASR